MTDPRSSIPILIIYNDGARVRCAGRGILRRRDSLRRPLLGGRIGQGHAAVIVVVVVGGHHVVGRRAPRVARNISCVGGVQIRRRKRRWWRWWFWSAAAAPCLAIPSAINQSGGVPLSPQSIKEAFYILLLRWRTTPQPPNPTTRPPPHPASSPP